MFWGLLLLLLLLLLTSSVPVCLSFASIDHTNKMDDRKWSVL